MLLFQPWRARGHGRRLVSWSAVELESNLAKQELTKLDCGSRWYGDAFGDEFGRRTPWPRESPDTGAVTLRGGVRAREPAGVSFRVLVRRCVRGERERASPLL